MISTAFWWRAPLAGELRSAPLPAAGAQEVLVRTRYSGVSRGSEALVAQGRVPASEAQRMRCPHQEGAFPFPVKYGYCVVGTVEEGPERLRGRRVFALHPHQDLAILPAGSVVPLPDDVPSERAVLAANLETALNAVWDASVLPGDRVAVVGAGAVGCLIARLCVQIPGSEVTLIDPVSARASIAERLGCDFSLPADATGEADVIFEASGAPSALALALSLASFEATILVASWYGEDEVALPLGAEFHRKRLRLISTQVSEVATSQRPRWNHARRIGKVIELLRDRELDVLISGESAFAEMPEDMPHILGSAQGVLCHRIVYP